MAVKRFQRLGVQQPETLVDKEPRTAPIFKAQVKFQTSGSSQGAVTSDVPSRYDSAKGADIQPTTTQGWGGRSIFAQPSPNDTIVTVVRRYSELIRSWGGFSIMPLFWLDTEPSYVDPPMAFNKWLIAAGREGSRWIPITPHYKRFTLYVKGELQSPV